MGIFASGADDAVVTWAPCCAVSSHRSCSTEKIMGLTLAVFIKDVPQITPGRLIELNGSYAEKHGDKRASTPFVGKCDNCFLSPSILTGFNRP